MSRWKKLRQQTVPKTRARTPIRLSTSEDGDDLHVTMKNKVCHNKAINRHPLVRAQPNRKVIQYSPVNPSGTLDEAANASNAYDAYPSMDPRESCESSNLCSRAAAL